MLDGNEKDLQHLQEQLASLRSEKEALEGILFDTSSNLEAVESKRQKLDKELQNTLLNEENLKGKIMERCVLIFYHGFDFVHHLLICF